MFPLRRSEFATSIPVNDEDEDADANEHIQSVMPKAGARMSFTAPKSFLAENEKEGADIDPMEAHRASRVSDREDEYKALQFLQATVAIPSVCVFRIPAINNNPCFTIDPTLVCRCWFRFSYPGQYLRCRIFVTILASRSASF